GDAGGGRAPSALAHRPVPARGPRRHVAHGGARRGRAFRCPRGRIADRRAVVTFALGARFLRGLAAAALVAACSASSSKDFGPDPFKDPFFQEGMGSSGVDEVLEHPAPSVGYLSNSDLYANEGEEEMIRRERRAAGAGSGREKTFGEKAEEATLATMSVLIGAGMAALPYLLGT